MIAAPKLCTERVKTPEEQKSQPVAENVAGKTLGDENVAGKNNGPRKTRFPTNARVLQVAEVPE